jgi:hypothetical protein
VVDVDTDQIGDHPDREVRGELGNTVELVAVAQLVDERGCLGMQNRINGGKRFGRKGLPQLAAPFDMGFAVAGEGGARRQRIGEWIGGDTIATGVGFVIAKCLADIAKAAHDP